MLILVNTSTNTDIRYLLDTKYCYKILANKCWYYRILSNRIVWF